MDPSFYYFGGVVIGGRDYTRFDTAMMIATDGLSEYSTYKRVMFDHHCWVNMCTVDSVDITWLVVYLPVWKMMEFVSWDDEIPNIWKI